MSTKRSALYQELIKRIRDGGFAIALSGGGHRATLATLGALIAIVDRGLAPKIIQVASVSGGSITNAFIAQRVQLEKLGPGELDGIATELTTTIIQKGVLTKGWIALLLITAVLFGVVVGIIFQIFVLPWKWLAVLIGIGITLLTLIARGLAVEWLLDRRYFRNYNDKISHRDQNRVRLSSISGRSIDHVFCMTDLVLGLPVYASTQNGGIIWRRLKPEQSFDYDNFPFQTFDAGRLSIAEIVRASAAFPGIPPRRLKIPSDPDNELVAESPPLAFLADGGMWNNLGTQVLREDKFIGSYAAWDNGVLRPYFKAPEDIPILCFNGSALLRPTRPWAFKIPLFALFRSLLQTTQILNANTVLPRIDTMMGAFRRRVWSGRRPNYLDPADLVADLRAEKELAHDYMPGTWGSETIRKTDPLVIEWEKDALIRIRIARESEEEEENTKTDWLAYVLGTQPEPEGSYPVCGLATADDWNALRRSNEWKQLVEKEGKGRVDAPTTLDRIETTLARRLIARGYLNTFLVSLFLTPLSTGEIERLKEFPARLDKIVGC